MWLTFPCKSAQQRAQYQKTKARMLPRNHSYTGDIRTVSEVIYRGHFITNQTTRCKERKSLNITIHLHCMIPTQWVIQ